MQIITDVKSLLKTLKIDTTQDFLFEDIDAAAAKYPLAVPESFVKKMQPKNINDPLLKQVLPSVAEQSEKTGFSEDPLQEKNATTPLNILHKYHGRALLILTSQCPINCRFCFRRHSLRVKTKEQENLKEAFDYITANKTITEIILSGGDPLFLPNKKLQNILQKLAKIDHLKRVRIHTRIPLVMSERINKDLIKILTSSRLQCIIVTHCNHASEIDKNTTTAINLMLQAKILIFNQSVLLRDINDSENALVSLCEKLGSINITPYYLHILDKVKGSAHFDVSLKKALSLHRKIRTLLPGYLVPRLVVEKHGEKSKIWHC